MLLLFQRRGAGGTEPGPQLVQIRLGLKPNLVLTWGSQDVPTGGTRAPLTLSPSPSRSCPPRPLPASPPPWTPSLRATPLLHTCTLCTSDFIRRLHAQPRPPVLDGAPGPGHLPQLQLQQRAGSAPARLCSKASRDSGVRWPRRAGRPRARGRRSPGVGLQLPPVITHRPRQPRPPARLVQRPQQRCAFPGTATAPRCSPRPAPAHGAPARAGLQGPHLRSDRARHFADEERRRRGQVTAGEWPSMMPNQLQPLLRASKATQAKVTVTSTSPGPAGS